MSPDPDYVVGAEELVLPPHGITIVTENAYPFLIDSLRKFDVQGLVEVVSAFSAMQISERDALKQAIRSEGGDPRGALRDYQLALILKLAIGDPDRDGLSGAKPTPMDVARLCRLVVSSRCAADTEDRFDPASYLIRTAYQQFWDQEGLDVFPRGLIILRELADLLPAADRFDLNRAFEENIGIRFDTLVVLGFSLFAMTSRQPGKRFGIDQFLNSPDLHFAREDVERFFHLIGCSYDAFKQRANDRNVNFAGFELYNLNPLVRWPALEHSGGGYTVPIPRLLLDRITNGIYYDMLEKLPVASSSRFGSFWGNAFDRYLGQLMSTTPNFGQPVPGRDLVTDGKACDWILESETGALLKECKTRGLSLRSKTTGLQEDIERDVRARPDGSSLPHGLAQLAESVRTLRTVAPDRPSEAVLVTMDEIYLANEEWHPIKEQIGAAAAMLTDAAIPDFELASVSDVEALSRVVEQRNVTPFAILQDKRSDPEMRTHSLSTYINKRWRVERTPVSLHRAFLARRLDDLLGPFRRED